MQFDSKHNSIGFLRLFLALAVIYAHAGVLGGFGYDFIYHFSNQVASVGSIAVDSFFSLSGYLIAASYLRLQSLPLFLWHRVLRIFPAYWVCLIVVGIGTPLLFGAPPDLGYIQHNFLIPLLDVFQAIVGFILPLLSGSFFNAQTVTASIPFMQIQHNIQDLFPNNPHPNTVNASLWTLQHEFRAYVAIGMLGWLGLLRKNVILGLLTFIWIAYVAFYRKGDLAISPIRFSAFFLMGAAFYFWEPPLKHSLAFASLIVSIAGLASGESYIIVAPLTTTYLMLWLAAALPFADFGKGKDYSYGLYIYAFPIQQILSAYHLNQWGFLVYFLLSVCCTIIPAALSWHLVESTALHWKHKFSKKKLPSEFA
ncbi:acyltransferase [Phormidium sp. FACHB-592]|uniref:Acyltransferase n=1 Tax=Stenomitos frigidus AS-A4 TaxID=2933935 RepID=A0ABV0KIA1_9CYAN|nr:acyltransferase [Phormidium sp. FACHB-592]MBD2074129.1 acyltransferase [Phormidium sp. FACHB-592]